MARGRGWAPHQALQLGGIFSGGFFQGSSRAAAAAAAVGLGEPPGPHWRAGLGVAILDSGLGRGVVVLDARLGGGVVILDPRQLEGMAGSLVLCPDGSPSWLGEALLLG